mgnify:CR=1 FL=1|tara:strand:+ start:77 stop:637 length:561 start_codon:yes stop_codon:yes gene_type:complete
MSNIKITDLPAGTTLVGTELFESVQSATSVKLTSDLIKAFANSAPTLLVETANTNTPATAATLSHQTSGTAAAGIGTRLAFQCETSASNVEIGALLSAVSTNVGAGTEAFNLQVLLMAAGSGAAAVATFNSNGNFGITGNTLNIPVTRTPASASATGTAGDICWDASYVYVCVATDTWKRAAISTW